MVHHPEYVKQGLVMILDKRRGIAGIATFILYTYCNTCIVHVHVLVFYCVVNVF